MVEKVLELAAALGKREADEELRTLCRAAVEELKGLLREGVTPEGCGGAFELGAAWLALSGADVAGGGEVESFTAGEVSIRRGDGRARREVLRLQARQVMRPYLRDEGFLFRNVRG